MESKELKTVDATADEKVPSSEESQVGTIVEDFDALQRRLGNRQTQLLAIEGSIGTALFVSIESGLTKGGPGVALPSLLYLLLPVGPCQ